MTYNDTMWSYAEEFSNKIVDSVSGKSTDDVIHEIVEIMLGELYKKDRRNVIEKMDKIMFCKDEDEISATTWTKIRGDLTALLGL